MINLTTKPYCDWCSDFEPCVSKFVENKKVITNLCCEHSYICNRIAKQVSNNLIGDPIKELLVLINDNFDDICEEMINQPFGESPRNNANWSDLDSEKKDSVRNELNHWKKAIRTVYERRYNNGREE